MKDNLDEEIARINNEDNFINKDKKIGESSKNNNDISKLNKIKLLLIVVLVILSFIFIYLMFNKTEGTSLKEVMKNTENKKPQAGVKKLIQIQIIM